MVSGIFRAAFVVIYIAVFSIITVSAGDKPDEVWIIGNPSELVVFNRYQQRLSRSECLGLPHNGPWWIQHKAFLLSDNFTRAVKTEFENNVYFLQTNDDGDLVNQSSTEILEKINPAEIYHDTLRVISENLMMRQPGNDELSMRREDLACRIFRFRNRIFIKDLDSGSYGWIPEKNDAGWVIYHPPSTVEEYEHFLYARVDRIIQDYNTRLQRLIEYLNTRYNRQKNPPQWVMQKSPAGLHYRFGSGTEFQDFLKSRDYLIQELKDLLHGTGYDLRVDGNLLAIYRTT
jgi:hypothetical protein